MPDNDNVLFDKIDKLKDRDSAEHSRLMRIYELLENAGDGIKSVEESMQSDIKGEIASANAALANAEESMRQSLYNDIMYADAEVEAIGKAAKRHVDFDLQNAVNAIVETGNLPVMTFAEESLYKMHSPGDAYKLASMMRDLEEGNNGESFSPDISEPILEAMDPTFPHLPIYTPPPPVSPPPPPPLIPPPPPPPVTFTPPAGTHLCYTYITNEDGSVSSLPFAIDDGLGCPPGMHNTPYVPPPPPPFVIPPGLLPPPPPVFGIGSTLINSDAEALACTNQGGTVLVLGEGENGPVRMCIVAPPPPPPPPISPPVITPIVDCEGLGDTFAVIGGKCVPIDTLNCNWPVPVAVGKSPPIEPPPPCPPDCIRIDAVIGNTVEVDLACTAWDDPRKVCNAFRLTAAQGDTITTGPDGKVTQSTGILGTLAGFFLNPVGEILSFVPAIFKPLFGLSGDASIISDVFSAVMSAGFASMNVSLPKKVNECCGPISHIMNEMTALSIAGWMETLSRAPVSYLFTDSKYSLQYMCPQFLPTQSEIDMMYLANMLNAMEWECYTKANGNLPNTHKMSMETKRNRIDARQAIFLHRYEKMEDREYSEEMRSLGFINRRDRTNFEDSLVNLPGLSDITRYMVRDADDPLVVEKYKLDQGFDEKYKEKLKLWAKAQGIPDDVAKYHWRSHWEYPSNTALYEMIRRLRPGKVDRELAVTKDDALKLMEINDIAPGWREKLLAVSYAVPTRTDTKRGFFIDALTEREVLSLLEDEGYTAEDAKLIFKIFEKEKELYTIGINRRNSAFTPKQIANMLAEGTLPEEDAKRLLRDMGYKETSIDKVIFSGRAKANANTNKKCINAIRRSYFRGANDQDQTLAELRQHTQNDFVANNIMSGWSCEFNASLKDLPATKNVSLFLKGIIDIGTLQRRLTNLGYTAEAVDGWIRETLWKHRENIRKALEKAARDAERLRRQQQQEQRERIAMLTEGIANKGQV